MTSTQTDTDAERQAATATRRASGSTTREGSLTQHVDSLWLAVEARDASFDGRFYYGVRTTGVFCRPACASRTPRRENVSFFPLPEAARAAGFRPCLRCRPEETAARDPRAELVRKVCRLIEGGGVERPDLRALGAGVGLSPSHLLRLFKSLVGVTPRRYAEAVRSARFREGVRGGRSVAEATYEAGYGSSSRLYEDAAGRLGMTPAKYRRGGRGESIRFAVAESPLGPLLAAATDRGVCAVRLGDDAAGLERELRAEFAEAVVARDDAGLASELRALLDYLAGRLPHPDLPLDVRGTAFQKRVWDELRRIPRGATASYAEIARRIGRPSSVRAVARACAGNPVALVTPCHRVLRGDGQLAGFRWGVERKRELLALEREDAAE
jgi:AraC family transcriptional regulator, regulatory protein of adaptative response / methylated-DNA-[protein]-cysteine methyltransferase